MSVRGPGLGLLPGWHQLDYVVGGDPHRDVEAVGVVEVRGGVVVFETCVAADSGGYRDAFGLAETYAPGRRAFAVEGSGSDGAGLTRFLSGSGERVFEVGRLPKQASREREDGRARRCPGRPGRAHAGAAVDAS